MPLLNQLNSINHKKVKTTKNVQQKISVKKLATVVLILFSFEMVTTSAQESVSDDFIEIAYAKDWGFEGIVFVKFVVDEDDKITFATTSEDIETSVAAYVDDLEKQAESAIKASSGNWIPGEINGISVPTLAVVPLTSDFIKDPFIPALIR